MDADLGSALTKDVTSQAWRTALDPKGEWIAAVLRAADTRLRPILMTTVPANRIAAKNGLST